MPEYLAPGVYVEETSFRSKSIEGVGTSTTGFVGATRYGPTAGEPELMTSFNQFERIYGGLDPLDYGGTEVTNYLAHAVRAFFDNGGSRLYIARAYEPPPLPKGPAGETPEAKAARVALLGRATAAIPAPNALIGQTNDAAISATNTVLGALSKAITELQQARVAAINILQFAVAQLFSPPVTTAKPTLKYDYINPAEDVGAQLTNRINALPDGSDKNRLNEALTSSWQAVINSADEQLQATNTALSRAETAQTAVSTAYAEGVTEGTNLSGVTSNLTDLRNAKETARNKAATVKTTADAMADEANALADAFKAVTNAATATTAIGAIQPLVTAATAVLETVTNNPNNANTAIHEAAKLATRESRLAEATASTDWLARFPGAAGNMTISVNGRLGTNVLARADPLDSTSPLVVRQVRSGDLVVIQRSGTALIYSAIRSNNNWIFTPSTGSDLPLSGLNPNSDRVIPLTISVEIQLPGKFVRPQTLENLTLSGLPNRSRDSLNQLFAAEIANRLQEMETPVILQVREGRTIGDAQLTASLLNITNWEQQRDAAGNPLFDAPGIARLRPLQSVSYGLTGGSDGKDPEPSYYEGSGGDNLPVKSGLKALEDLEDISIVAAPGYSHDYVGDREQLIQAINQLLISHCERLRYRVAILDSPNNQSLSGVRNYRAIVDSKYTALYYPWVRILDPISEQELDLPPSGFMAGIYARSDVEIGVHKAPANEVVRGAIGLETLINKAQQDVLNPLGINCVRFFEGRGIRVWGARTISSDPEWKYLNVRRYFAYLEASIDRSTQWAVFEPNGEQLWANVRRTIESFLENEWRSGRLAGAKVEEAFFVRCDRSTMTQNDLDNGRMICLIGVAPLYPAEFVIFRIGQWTGDRRS